jgi:hypothetical protein
VYRLWRYGRSDQDDLRQENCSEVTGKNGSVNWEENSSRPRLAQKKRKLKGLAEETRRSSSRGLNMPIFSLKKGLKGLRFSVSWKTRQTVIL